MCDKVAHIHTYHSTRKFVSIYLMSHEMCDKPVRIHFVFDSIHAWYKTQEMCDRVVSQDPSLIVYSPDKYKTQRMCDKSVSDSLTAIKYIPDWFVTSKTIKELFIDFFADENILYFNEDSSKVACSCNEMCILNIDLNNINLDTNFYEDDPDPIILIRILAWHTRFDKHEAVKKNISEELMLITE